MNEDLSELTDAELLDLYRETWSEMPARKPRGNVDNYDRIFYGLKVLDLYRELNRRLSDRMDLMPRRGRVKIPREWRN